MKIAFLDRDGTINKDYPDEDWKDCTTPEILEGSIEGLLSLLELGYEIIIVTNQYIINGGIITIMQYHDFQHKLLKLLKSNNIEILDTFYCPHTDVESCNCKKPKTGLIDLALKKYPNIDLPNSIYIGDSYSDQELASQFELKFFGINGHYFKTCYHSINEVVLTNREVL